ncbi:MAG: phosphoenolpyruvate synthase [Candidatus Nanohaloarchaeota archaeon]|nr:phosphoenolpyruvate synthase [Candidatus Nanohaloarchaeota archaeon]
MVSNSKESKLILWFEEVDVKDVRLVGGKNASLGELYRNLTPKGINVPNGFAITATAYRYFMKENGLIEKIKDVLKDLDTKDVNNLRERGAKVRDLILHAEFPEKLKREIEEAYDKLSAQYNTEAVDVAVRSSATAEDLPDASFAGQQETYLNIRGKHALMDAVKKCFASLFTDRAISYREDKGFDHFSIALSVGVQKMVRSDKGASGVMFTLDTETGFRDVVLINAAYGLGENVVQGAVNPDQYYVFKPTLKKGFKPIISKRLGTKEIKMIYTEDSMKPTKNVETTEKERNSYALNDDEILTLAKWGMLIEEHYSQKYGRDMPMDIEWAKDGIENKLYIVQARPETVQSQKDKHVIRQYELKEHGKILVKGLSVGDKIAVGKVRVIEDVSRIHEFQPGEVLVTDKTDPDWEPIMKIASAIVTNKGGRTSHAAIVSRELGIPAVVGTGNATEVLKTGQDVTVSCAEGTEGYVYEGRLKYEVKEIDLTSIPETKTKIMMNVANPEQAFNLSFLPNDGVGLAREEFIINSHIGIHPRALLDYKKMKEEGRESGLIKQIDERTKAYDDKVQFYIDKLAEGIALIAAAFYPKDVIVRFSDFKSNEYRNLLGGYLYEPQEENPMIGWRGASRYYSKEFKDAFGLELLAIKKVRDEMGLVNVKVMIPFCRTVEEGKKVLNIMKEYGLERGANGLEVYVMVEIPSNVILIDEFAKHFDGFSIGSNDLTQLTLGVDRDSALVAHVYDERNEAVKNLIGMAIKGAKRNGRKIGICGQAPSDFPEFAEFLVEQGIDSISLNPDTVIKTRFRIAEVEKKMEEKEED